LLIERAGIEFDPAVVKVFLSLEPMKELESFARAEESPLNCDTPDTVNNGGNLISSFMRSVS